MSRKSETQAKLDQLNNKYERLSNEKAEIQNHIKRILQEISEKELEVSALQQNWMRNRSQENHSNNNNNAQQEQKTQIPATQIKEVNEAISQFQAEMKTLIQKSKFIGGQIDEIEMSMLDLATKSTAVGAA